MVSRGSASRLRRMTRPERTRVKEKLNEIVVILNRSAGISLFIYLLGSDVPDSS